jgi:DNA-binding transcriptional MocR family regulator
MWNLELKRGKVQPLYKQIVAFIEQAVENGLLNGGERLPSERAMGELLGVNRSTIVRALDDLEDRGVLLRRRGSGSYVNGEKWGLRQYPIMNWQTPARARPDPAAAARERLVVRYRQEARQSGRTLTDCSGSEPAADLLPSLTLPEPAWSEVLSRELRAEGSLTGLSFFRETVREHLRVSLGLSVEREQILITSGARQALFLISQCLLKPGDAVGIEAPSYFYSLPLFQAAGLRLFALPLDREGVVVEGLDAVVARRGLRMIFLNPVFQNPTGHVMSRARKEELVGYCRARRLPIVEDDAYSLLGFSPNTGVSPIKCQDTRGQVIYVGSLSSYMGPKIRAGWLAAPKEIVDRLGEVRLHMDAGLSVLPQLLADSYLRLTYPEHVVSLRARLAKRSAALQDKIGAEFGGYFDWFPPSGGLHLYLYSRKGQQVKDSTLLEKMLRCGLIPAPGSDFGDAGNNFSMNFSKFSEI